MCNGHRVAMQLHAPCGIVFVLCMFVNIYADKKKEKTVLTPISVSYATGTEDNIAIILSVKRYLFGSLLSVGCMTILKCPITQQ